MRKYGFLLLLLLALPLAACAAQGPYIITGDDIPDDMAGGSAYGDGAAAGNVPEQRQTLPGELPLEFSDTLTDAAGSTFAGFTMTVPQEIYDAFTPEAGRKIADDLLAFAAGQSEAFQEEMAALHEQDASLEASCTLELALFYQDSQIVSLTGQGYSYVSGAAHPNIHAYGLVYDAASGQRIGIAQMLGESWQEELFPAIVAQIESSGQREAYFQDLDTLLPDAFREEGWYADGDSLYVVYNAATVAPYAAGTPVFTIPR